MEMWLILLRDLSGPYKVIINMPKQVEWDTAIKCNKEISCIEFRNKSTQEHSIFVYLYNYDDTM